MRTRIYGSAAALVLLGALVACELFAPQGIQDLSSELGRRLDHIDQRIELAEKQRAEATDPAAVAAIEADLADAREDRLTIAAALKDVQDLQKKSGGAVLESTGFTLAEWILVALGVDKLGAPILGGLKRRSEKKKQEFAEAAAERATDAMRRADGHPQSGGAPLA